MSSKIALIIVGVMLIIYSTMVPLNEFFEYILALVIVTVLFMATLFIKIEWDYKRKLKSLKARTLKELEE